jgi:hypothetical protein
MNEWGTPDWRDAAAYGDVKRWSFDRWRWEFYRRRDDLREYFDARADAQYENYAWFRRQLGKSAPPAPDEPGFLLWRSGTMTRKTFGYERLPNPRIGEQPPEAIIPFGHDGIRDGVLDGHSLPLGEFLALRFSDETFDALIKVEERAGLDHSKLSDEHLSAARQNLRDQLKSGRFGGKRDFHDGLLKLVAKCRAVHLDEGEVAVTFDLNRPLEPQLRHARDLLQLRQSALHGKPLQKRRHPAKWLGYLRTLDAREAGATWGEIAALHPRTAKTEQTARDIWEQARALCFNF